MFSRLKLGGHPVKSHVLSQTPVFHHVSFLSLCTMEVLDVSRG